MQLNINFSFDGRYNIHTQQTNKIIKFLKFFSNNFDSLVLSQQYTIELLVHLRKLPFFLRTNLQLPPTVDLGPKIGTAYGYIQGADLLQLPRARLFRDLSAASEGSSDEA